MLSISASPSPSAPALIVRLHAGRAPQKGWRQAERRARPRDGRILLPFTGTTKRSDGWNRLLQLSHNSARDDLLQGSDTARRPNLPPEVELRWRVATLPRREEPVYFSSRKRWPEAMEQEASSRSRRLPIGPDRPADCSTAAISNNSRVFRLRRCRPRQDGLTSRTPERRSPGRHMKERPGFSKPPLRPPGPPQDDSLFSLAVRHPLRQPERETPKSSLQGFFNKSMGRFLFPLGCIRAHRFRSRGSEAALQLAHVPPAARYKNVRRRFFT
jgi:hypothetical protein